MKTQLDSVNVKSILDSLILWVDPKKQQCTNESMASNPTLRDLSGNGHDATCYNFAWSGMSGIGGYNLDASLIHPNQSDKINIEVSESTVTYSRVDSTRNILAGSSLLYVNITNNDLPINEEYGIKAGEYGCVVYQTESANAANITLLSLQPYETGKFTINQEELDNGKMILMFGNSVEIPAGGSGSFELLPQYPNALVSDGVDDYVKVSGLPILTKERGYTIIAKRDLLNYNDGKYGMFISKQYGDIVLNICIEQFNSSSITNNIAYCRSFGKYLSFPLDSIDKSFLVQTSNKYNGMQYNGEATTSDTPYLFLFSSGTGWNLKSVLYSFLLFDRDLTDAEIEWVKENMVEADGVMMYDWMDKDLFNNFIEDGSRATGSINSDKMVITGIVNPYARFFETKGTNEKVINSYKIKVTGVTDNVHVLYSGQVNGTETIFLEISQDGIYTLPQVEGRTIGFKCRIIDNNVDTPINITIQQLLTHFNMANIKFYRGPKSSYVLLTHLDGIYFSTDSHEIIVNNIIYGVGKAIGDITYNASNRLFTLTIVGNNSTTSTITLDLATSSTAGLMSAEDKQKLDLLTGGDSGSIQQLIEEAINTLKATIDAYTINGKAISTNPVLSGLDITLTGYVSEVKAPIVTSTDSVNEGILKLEENLSTLLGIVNKNYLTVGISSSLTVFEEGVLITPTLNISVKFDGSVVEPDTLELKKGNNLLTTDSSTTSYKDSEGITTTTTYSVTISYLGVIKSASVVVRSYYAMYFGFNSKSSGITQEDILALTKQPIKANANGTYTISGAEQGEYGWFCVPTEFTINKMTSSGFDVPLESPSTVSVNAHNYKCYRTSNALAAGNMNVVIS